MFTVKFLVCVCVCVRVRACVRACGAAPRICDFFCDVDYYVYPQSSCQEFCHRDIDDLWDVFDSFCDIGSLTMQSRL